MPDVIEPGTLYLSETWHTAIHLCACGCRIKTVTPIDNARHATGHPHYWSITPAWSSPLVSLLDSIKNNCGAHYYITDNKAIPCADSV